MRPSDKIEMYEYYIRQLESELENTADEEKKNELYRKIEMYQDFIEMANEEQRCMDCYAPRW